VAAQQTGEVLNTLIARLGDMPYRLQ
jgi:hypothetical protein